LKQFLRFLVPGGVLVAAVAGCGPRDDSSQRPSGTIEVDEARVGSRYGGRVERVRAREGDALATGQVIVELAADELKARREQVAALLSELETGPRKEDIAVAKAEWEAQTTELELARIDRQRALELFTEKTIAVNERDRAVSHAQTLEQTAAAAKARYELLLAGTRPERLTQARAQLAEIDAQLREMVIVAPTNAVLEVLGVKVGDLLPPNGEAATLLFTNHLWVRVFVPQPWLGQIKLGQPVSVRADAFPGREFTGSVEQIGRAAEFTPRNVQTPADRIQQVFGVKVRLPNPGGELRAGMSVEVSFLK
jgi:HlyD family secretion protein